MQDIFIEFLPPWVETNLQPAFYDAESGTILQQVSRMYAKMNEIIKSVNNMDKVIKEYVDYIDHYFENLDVQEEINNKLDDMADSGELAEYIAQYANLPCIHAYATIADMASSENLVDGSYARAMSKTVAGTGDGFYYKIRTRIEADDPDGENLVAIGDDLVAEKIPDAGIEALENYVDTTKAELEAEIEDVDDAIDNRYNKSAHLSLQNYLIYDMDSTYYSQGSCMDENGTAYVYTASGDTGGNLLVFDKTTETLTNTISTNFNHGSSMVKKGGYIYVAPGTSGRAFLKYDVGTGTVTSDNTFAGETAYECVLSVSDFDASNILVTLGTTNTYQLATSICPCIFNLSTSEYTKITMTNSKAFNISMFYAIQCVSYHNGHIYVLCSEPNCVLDFVVDGNTADLQKIYQIPRRDLLGLTIGEVEAISNVPGTDYFLLSTHVKENQKISKRTIKLYFCSFDTELPQLYKSRLLTENQSYFDLCYLDGSKTSLYEDGSETYPFKTFTRAIECATHSNYYTGNQIMVKDGTYEIGRINSAVGILNIYDENTAVVISGNSQISNSNIQIKVRSGTLTFNGTLDIDDNSIFNTFGGMVTFKNTVEASMNSQVSIEQALLDFSGTTAQVVARASATLNIGISENSTPTEASRLFRLSSNAVLITNSDGTMQTFDMEDIGNAWTRIQAGMHSADT